MLRKYFRAKLQLRYPLMEKRKGWYMKREQLMRMNNRKEYRLTGLHRLKREDS